MAEIIKCEVCGKESKGKGWADKHSETHASKTVQMPSALEPVPATVSTNQPDDRLSKIEDRLDRLTDLLTTVAEKQIETESKKETIVVTPESPKELFHKTDLSGLFPKEWRAVIDRVLGNDFVARIEESSGGNFILEVLLPERFDRRVGEKRGQDISTGLIRRASDINDVEHWCKKIAETIVKSHPEFKKATV